MTKEEMIRAMLKNINWSNQKKENEVKQAMKKSKTRIEEVYHYWTGHQDKSLFCISTL